MHSVRSVLNLEERTQEDAAEGILLEQDVQEK